MSYQIVYHPAVQNDVKNLPKNIKDRLKTAIERRLLTDPLHYGDPLKQSLSGYRKLRVGDYRIIYKIKKYEVIILKIGHRKEVYEGTPRFLE